MPNIGLTELVIVAILALLVFGPKRLPAAGRSLGEALRHFKDGLTGRKPEVEVIYVEAESAPR